MVTPGPEASPGVLNSWKEIAAFLDRDVRTVMRWEQTRALPVHRLPGGPKSAVYALQSEVEAWRKGREFALVGPATESRLTKAPGLNVRVAAGLVCLLLAGAGVFAISKLVRKPAVMTGLAPMVRLTYDRFSGYPAISADGRLLAYTSDREGKFDIYIQQMGGHQSVRVTRNEADNWHPSLSPDGSRVAFRSDRDGGGLYVVETLGGTERKVADHGDFPSFSPDGGTIAYLVRNPFSKNAKMFLVPAEGGSPRPLQPEFEVPPVAMAYTVPMWSPDGRHLLFEGVRAGDSSTRGLWVTPLAGGSATQVLAVQPQPRGTIRAYVAWTGKYLYYVQGTSVQGMPLMRVPVKSDPWRVAGPAEPLTSASTVCGTARIAADGRMVLMIASAANNIWSMPLLKGPQPGEVRLRQETATTDNKLAMSVAANGSRLAYASVLELGHIELRLMNLATRQMAMVPLSGDSQGTSVRLSADGSRLGYRDSLDGRQVSYSVPAANPGPADPVCEGCTLVGFFSRSEDALVSYGRRLVRQNMSTGQRTILTETPVADPVLSPDDSWVAFVAPVPDGSSGLFVAPANSQISPQDRILVSDDRNFIGSPQWSREGDVLYYISYRDSSACVWAQSFDARNKTFGEPMHIYHGRGFPSLKVNPARSIGLTPDRVYLFMSTITSDIWTINIGSQ